MKEQDRNLAVHSFNDQKQNTTLSGMFRVIDLSNNEQILFEENLVVDEARKILRDLMYYADVQHSITKIKFGTKGITANSTPTNQHVVSPTLADTDIFETNSILKYEKSLQKNLQGDYEVKYSCILNANEANLNNNSYPISEAGLFTGNNKMFSHKTFPVITKTSDRVYKFEWVIQF